MGDAGKGRWLLPTVVLCTVGFLKDINPLDSFYITYLRQAKNLTEIDLTNDVTPISTYTLTVALVLVFALSDILRYKPVIIVGQAACFASYSLLLWAYGLKMMRLSAAIDAISLSADVAYYAYIFAAVSSEHFQKVSSYTRSIELVGRFVSAVLAQLLISFNATTLTGLLYISLASSFLAFCISFFLPATRSEQSLRESQELLESSSQGNRNATKATYSSTADTSQGPSDRDDSGPSTVPQQPSAPSLKEMADSVFLSIKKFCQYFWTDLKNCYGRRHLLEWSMWWTIATCCDAQISSYIQNLWDVLLTNIEDTTNSHLYNGAAEALSMLFGAVSSFLIMFPDVNWDRYGALFLGLVSILDSILLVIMGLTTNMWLCYAFYILFRSSYQLVITIATFQVAKGLEMESYGLIFGLNTFLSQILATILTVIFAEEITLSLPPNILFLVYGGNFCLLGLAFFVRVAQVAYQQGWQRTFSCCHGDDEALLDGQERVEMRATDGMGSTEDEDMERRMAREERMKLIY